MADSIINVKNLRKYFKVYQKEAGLVGAIKSLFHREYLIIKAVDNISFDIKEGELVGFIGPNGAGKTTTLKILAGLLYASSGEVKVLGFDPFKRQPNFQKQFSLIMGQKNQLWWDLPAIDSFILNKEIYEISDAEFNKTLEELSDMLDVKDILKIPVRKLSLGQRMKCELIASLIHSPKILFLDEPTIGLDVVAQKNMRDFIKEYNKKYKATIILTSHYMADVKELCKRVIIINEGKILYDGSLEKIVNKFAPFKVISADFEKEVEREEIEKLGKLEDFDYSYAKILVNKKDLLDKINKLLANFKVSDLTIEDPPLEDIIRNIFTSKNN